MPVVLIIKTGDDLLILEKSTGKIGRISSFLLPMAEIGKEYIIKSQEY